MDSAVCRRRAAHDRIAIVEIAVDRFGARLPQPRGRGVRPCQSRNAVARRDQLFRDYRPI
jgi:hypothetical protein